MLPHLRQDAGAGPPCGAEKLRHSAAPHLKNYSVLAFPGGARPNPASPVKKQPIATIFSTRPSAPGAAHFPPVMGPKKGGGGLFG